MVQNKEESKVANAHQIESPSVMQMNSRQMRCLLANDDEMQLNVLKILMSKFDFQVIAVKNGYEAFMEAQLSV